MCGIAGWVLHPDDSGINLAAAAHILGVEMMTRGRDATGICTVNHRGHVKVRKDPVKAELFFAARDGIGAGARLALIHTRQQTQGSPLFAGNNHPIVSDDIVGVHNGMIRNDDELFKANPQWVRRAQVDSEVIFAGLAKHGTNRKSVLEVIVGSMAIAWIDKRDPLRLNLARGSSNPIHLARTAAGSLFFASTFMALREVEKRLKLDFKESMLVEGQWISWDPLNPETFSDTKFDFKACYAQTTETGAMAEARRQHLGMYGSSWDEFDDGYAWSTDGKLVEKPVKKEAEKKEVAKADPPQAGTTTSSPSAPGRALNPAGWRPGWHWEPGHYEKIGEPNIHYHLPPPGGKWRYFPGGWVLDNQDDPPTPDTQDSSDTPGESSVELFEGLEEGEPKFRDHQRVRSALHHRYGTIVMLSKEGDEAIVEWDGEPVSVDDLDPVKTTKGVAHGG